MNDLVPGTLLRVKPSGSPNMLMLSQHPEVCQIVKENMICSLRSLTICMFLEHGGHSIKWSGDVARVFTPYGMGWISLKYCEKL